MIRTAMLVMVVAVSAGPALAQQKTAFHLYEGCKGRMSDDTALAKGICLGLGMGLAAGLSVAKSKVVCIPDKTSAGQYQDVFLRWAERNPNKLHWPPTAAFLKALMEAYPCPK